MTDVSSNLQVVLQEAEYLTWFIPSGEFTTIGFEDEVIIGFGVVFPTAAILLANWQELETQLLARHAAYLKRAGEKAWNVCSVFVSAASATEDETRAVRRIEENLERTRKIAACALASREDYITALLPLMPLQYRPRLENEDLSARLTRRIEGIAPQVSGVILDDAVSAAEVVRLLRSGA